MPLKLALILDALYRKKWKTPVCKNKRKKILHAISKNSTKFPEDGGKSKLCALIEDALPYKNPSRVTLRLYTFHLNKMRNSGLQHSSRNIQKFVWQWLESENFSSYIEFTQNSGTWGLSAKTAVNLGSVENSVKFIQNSTKFFKNSLMMGRNQVSDIVSPEYKSESRV